MVFKTVLENVLGKLPRDLHSHPACVRFLSGQKFTEFACPAIDFYRLMEKQAYVDSTHLNISDTVSIIIYGTDKIHNHLIIN